MTKQVKRLYRFLAWFFSMALAAGTLAGCIGGKYGPPPNGDKYGPPPASGYEQNIKESVAKK